MAKHVDIARALKDRDYFNSLSEEEKEMVRKASPVGGSGLRDKDLDSVSGGLGGGESLQGTTTTTNLQQCLCNADGSIDSNQASPNDCTCAC
jgi:hypothetical protein